MKQEIETEAIKKPKQRKSLPPQLTVLQNITKIKRPE